MLQLPQSVTSFYDYFKLTPNPEKAANLLGYSFMREKLSLPRTATDLLWVNELRRSLTRRLPKIQLVSEAAKRELLIAPVLGAIVDRYKLQLRVEYEVYASPQLHGDLDYFLQSREQFVVVEGKNEDMNRGASQLVAEMAALDQSTQSESALLYGALSIGTVWQFCLLHRAEKRFEQDVQLYLVPDQVVDLCAILLGILKAEPDTDMDAA